MSPQRCNLATLTNAGNPQGMQHLHDHETQHRDLKAENCLVVPEDGQYRVKITDFGLSKSKTVATQTNERSVGTQTHMAPEIFANVSQKSNEDREKSDVYSYGIVMYEVVSRKVPWAGNDGAQIIAAVMAGLRPSPTPPNTPRALIELMEECWAHDTAMRPTFTRAVEALQDAAESMGIPTGLLQHNLPPLMFPRRI